MFKRIAGDRKVQTAGIGFLVAILVSAFGWDDTQTGQATEAIGLIVGVIGTLWKGGSVAANALAPARPGPIITRTPPPAASTDKPPAGASVPRPNGWTRGLPVLFILLTSAALVGNVGCDPMADRMVDRHSTELAADLRVRGQLARVGIEAQYEAVRAAKHTEIDSLWDASLKALELYGKLDAASSRLAAERYGGYHRIVDARVDAYKAAALEQSRWFDTAAETVLATMEYRQTKDAAIIEGAKAALAQFGATYAATKREPADESEAKAQGLIADLESKLQGMLQAYTGTPVPVHQ
jgi:hypothetical protein